MARVFLMLISVASLKIEVLSVEGVMMSTSCRTRCVRSCGTGEGQKPERPKIGLAQMAKADEPQARRQERERGLGRRCRQASRSRRQDPRATDPPRAVPRRRRWPET